MKVLLVNPPYTSIYGSCKSIFSVVPPLGVLYLAANLLKAGHDVRVVDMEAQEINVDDLLCNAKNSDMVGISFTTPQTRAAANLAKKIKLIDREIHVVVGGSQATAQPYKMLKYPYFDSLVIGEGDETIVELASCIEKHVPFNKVKGVLRKDEGGKIKENGCRPLIANLDALPLPAYELIDTKNYRPSLHRRFEEPIYSMITSRGCPFLCTYCASHLIWRRQVRYRSPTKVEEEVNHYVSSFGARGLMIWDDTFTLNAKRTIEICELIRRHEITFSCNTRVDTINRSIVANLKGAGCKMVFFGVESANEDTLRKLKRGATLSQIRKAFELCRQYEIETTASLMVTPWDTRESISTDLNFLKTIKPSYLRVSILTVHPGTDLYNFALENDYIKDVDYLTYNIRSEPLNQLCFSVTGQTRGDLKHLKDFLYKSFYLSSEYREESAKRGIKKKLKEIYKVFDKVEDGSSHETED